jgi:hypothetical protein
LGMNLPGIVSVLVVWASIFAFTVCLFQQSSPTNEFPDLTVDSCRRQQPARPSIAGSKEHHFRGGAGWGAALRAA